MNLKTIKDIKFDMENNTMIIEIKAPKTKEIKKIDVVFNGDMLLRNMKDRVKDLKYHFKYDGWGIDTRGVVSDVLYEMLGFHIDEVIEAYISEKVGATIEYKNNKSMLVKRDGYSPVFYDEYTGEIFIVENPKDKSYIFEYAEKNGYINLGVL